MKKKIKKLGEKLTKLEQKTLFADPQCFPVLHGLVDVCKSLLEIIHENSEFKENGEPHSLEETAND